jgi:hypothetical protein
MALRFLAKTGHVTVEADSIDAHTQLVHVTPKGREAQEADRLLHGDLERAWETQFGAGNIHGLRVGLRRLLDQRDGERARLSLGLQPYADSWRATKRYVEQTNAMIDDPARRLPHYPMVLHRGGWPDGS